MTTDPTAVLARIRQMADHWEQHLPEVIRTPAVVSALRAALESAEPTAAAPVSSAVPDHTLRDRVAEALYRRDWPLKQVWVQALPDDRKRYTAMAAAVLSVLPPPTDRATVLREAAEAVQPHGCLCRGRLRRLAAEAQPEPEAREDDEALRAKVDEAAATLRRVRSVAKSWEQQALPHSQARLLLTEVRDALAGPNPDPEPEPTPEGIVREHVTTLHLIGEQLAAVESWMWQHLADVRDAAVSGRPAADDEETP